MTFTSALSESQGVRRIRWAAAAIVALSLHAGGVGLGLVQQEDASDDAAGLIAVELAPVAMAMALDTSDIAPGPLAEYSPPMPEAAKEAKEEIEKELPQVEQSPAPDPEVVLPVPRPEEEQKPDEEEAPVQVAAKEETASQFSPLSLPTAPPKIDAPPAPRTAAPTPGSSRTSEQAQASWQKALTSHLNKHKRYPTEARTRGIKGVVKVEFTIDRNGRVTSLHVAESSGSPVLDEEALATLQRADPLPAPPELIAGASFSWAVPILFTIR